MSQISDLAHFFIALSPESPRKDAKFHNFYIATSHYMK